MKAPVNYMYFVMAMKVVGSIFIVSKPCKHNCACIDSITSQKTSPGPAAMYSVCAVSNFHIECVYSLAEASARITVSHQYAWLV